MYLNSNFLYTSILRNVSYPSSHTKSSYFIIYFNFATFRHFSPLFAKVDIGPRGFLDFAPKTTLFGPSSLFGSHTLSKNYDNSIQSIMMFPLMNSPRSSFFGYFRTRILDFRTVLAHFWEVLGVRVVHLNEEIW